MSNIVPIRKKETIYQDVKGTPYLKLNTKTGFFYVIKYKAGKGRLFKTTGERTVGRARTRADEIIAEFMGGRRVSGRRKLISGIINELDHVLEQDFKNGDRREKTRNHDRNYFPLLTRLFGETYADEIDEEWWESWVRNVGRKSERKTLFDVAKKLSKILTFAYERKYISRKPKIRNPDKQAKTGRIYTDEEISRIVSHADSKLLSQILLGYESGLRVYEVSGLRKDWLTFESPDRALLDLPHSFVKSNARKIILSPQASTHLWQIMKSDPSGSPFIYPSPTNPMGQPESAKVQNYRWRMAARKAGIPGRVWFRYLRHSFYNKTLLELKLPIQDVSQYGGTSIRTLQKHYLLQDPERTAGVALAIRVPEVKK